MISHRRDLTEFEQLKAGRRPAPENPEQPWARLAAMIASASQTEPPQLGRRIVRLFRPHRGALTLITISILVTSALSVIGALLVRQVFDKALFVPGGPDLNA